MLGGSRWCVWGQISCSPTISIINWLGQLTLSWRYTCPRRQLPVDTGCSQDIYLQQQSRDLKIRARWEAVIHFYCGAIISTVKLMVSPEVGQVPWRTLLGPGPQWYRMAITICGAPVTVGTLRRVSPLDREELCHNHTWTPKVHTSSSVTGWPGPCGVKRNKGVARHCDSVNLSGPQFLHPA